MEARKRFLTIGVLLLVVAPLLLAQSETGSMTGTVTDPSGAAVPAAEVTVRNTGTSVTFVSVTDATGIWRAPQLVPGVYEITVAAKGFSTMVRKDVQVRVADRLRVDLA